MCEADKERVEERPEEEEAILEKVREWRYCSFSSDCIITVKPSDRIGKFVESGAGCIRHHKKAYVVVVVRT